MRMRRIVLQLVGVCIFATLLSACERGNFGNIWDPRSLFMSGIPSGDAPYDQGWRDACQTMTGIIGSGMLRGQPFAYDPERGVYDKEYYKGWRDGMAYCNYYIDYDPI